MSQEQDFPFRFAHADVLGVAHKAGGVTEALVGITATDEEAGMDLARRIEQQTGSVMMPADKASGAFFGPPRRWNTTWEPTGPRPPYRGPEISSN